MSKATVRVDVWTDIVCPFCYIGEKRLRDAAARLGDDVTVEIVPRAFELDPFREGVEDVTSSLAKKFGSHERVHQANAQVAAMAEGEGLPYTNDRLTANTLTAHRLIAAAQAEAGLGLAVLHAIQEGHFAGTVNLGELDEVVAAAVAAGFDEARAREVAAGDEYTQQVRADEATAQQLGVTGVPFTVINQRFAIPGSVSTDQFEVGLRRGLEVSATA